MNFLKSLYFGKYQPKQLFEYDNSWVDLSVERENGHFSVLVKKSEAAKQTIILAHPMIDSGKHFFIEYGHAEMYHQLGYNVVLFDFNGFGESSDNGFHFKEDVMDAFEIAKKELPNSSFGIHGVSFGGSQIILAAIEVQEQINGLIIESAVSSNVDYYKGRSTKLYNLINLYSAVFPKKNAHNLYYNQIQKLKEVPLLFLYGKRDVKTPVWMGEILYKSAVSPVKELLVFDSTHLNTIDEVEEYAEVVDTFWKKNPIIT